MRNLGLLFRIDNDKQLGPWVDTHAPDLKTINAHLALCPIPTSCPVCNRDANPIPTAYHLTGGRSGLDIEVIFQCTLPGCSRLFFSLYEHIASSNPQKWRFVKSYPQLPVEKDFDKVNAKVSELSAMFVKIYNQAAAAETYGLSEIAGAGYRRALEFLVKDYLIKHEEKDPAKIKKKFLGNCIKEDILELEIKEMAERAAWLGNDETHYERLWTETDIEDLKNLIDLTLSSITFKLQAKRYKEKMPEGRK